MLLDRNTLVAATNNQQYSDMVAYPDSYLNQVFAEVGSQIARYLRFDPLLQRHTSDSGPTRLLTAGPFAGRYEVQLNHQPMVSANALLTINALNLSYALAIAVPSAVMLQYATVEQSTGQVYCLAPGAVEALAGVQNLTFGIASYGPYVSAVGFTADYYAGYATGINDPVLPAGAVAQPLPEDIRTAAVLLARERLLIDAAQNQPGATVWSGQQAEVRTADQTIRYTASRGAGKDLEPLGYGSPLAEAAIHRLERYQRKRFAVLL